MPDTRLNVGAPPGMHFAQEPRIATSGISVYVVWWDTRDSLGDIHLNRSLDAGATWLSPDVRLDVGTAPGAASSHSPEIAASGGSVYAVWVDERNGGQDVYFNRSMDRAPRGCTPTCASTWARRREKRAPANRALPTEGCPYSLAGRTIGTRWST